VPGRTTRRALAEDVLGVIVRDEADDVAPAC
jgi:hypothetical protein